MKKILLLTTVTALLSSCGIYTKYQPETTAPDNLYGEGTAAVVDTANLGNVDGVNYSPIRGCRNLLSKDYKATPITCLHSFV